MKTFHCLSARIVVWLAVVLIPIDILPAATCACHAMPGSCVPDSPLQPTLSGTRRAIASAETGSGCCRSAVTRPTLKTCCAGHGKHECCSKAATRSPDRLRSGIAKSRICQCMISASIPPAGVLPPVLPSDHFKSTTTPPVAVATLGVTTVSPTFELYADKHPFGHLSGLPDRLSHLCRLVI